MNICDYCEKTERLKGMMTEVCELSYSTVYLFGDQRYAGRCVVACKEHFKEIFELSETQRHRFFDDVAYVAEKLTEVFQSDKINYSIWGDVVNHLHVHLVPKTRDSQNWGQPFVHDPKDRIVLEQAALADRIELLKAALLLRRR